MCLIPVTGPILGFLHPTEFYNPHITENRFVITYTYHCLLFLEQ